MRGARPVARSQSIRGPPAYIRAALPAGRAALGTEAVRPPFGRPRAGQPCRKGGTNGPIRFVSIGQQPAAPTSTRTRSASRQTPEVSLVRIRARVGRRRLSRSAECSRATPLPPHARAVEIVGSRLSGGSSRFSRRMERRWRRRFRASHGEPSRVSVQRRGKRFMRVPSVGASTSKVDGLCRTLLRAQSCIVVCARSPKWKVRVTATTERDFCRRRQADVAESGSTGAAQSSYAGRANEGHAHRSPRAQVPLSP
jgi:hypothetical protein